MFMLITLNNICVWPAKSKYLSILTIYYCIFFDTVPSTQWVKLFRYYFITYIIVLILSNCLWWVQASIHMGVFQFKTPCYTVENEHWSKIEMTANSCLGSREGCLSKLYCFTEGFVVLKFLNVYRIFFNSFSIEPNGEKHKQIHHCDV